MQRIHLGVWYRTSGAGIAGGARLAGAAVFIALALCSAPLRAQHLATARRDTARATTSHLRANAWLAVGFGAATAAALTADGRVAHWMQQPARHNDALNTTANVFENLAIPGAPLLAAGTYAIGLWRHDSTLTDLGLHSGEAMVAAGAVALVIRGAAGRARPRVDITRPHDFEFGRGFTKGDNYQSFPSLHTLSAFALASALTTESGRRWPEHQKLIEILAYGSATLGGAARLYHNAHWTSDVILGAGLGTLAGRMVVQWQHAHPDNWVDRTFQHFSIIPTSDGSTHVAFSAAW